MYLGPLNHDAVLIFIHHPQVIIRVLLLRGFFGPIPFDAGYGPAHGQVVLADVFQEVAGVLLVLLVAHHAGHDESGIQTVGPDIFSEGQAAGQFDGALDHPGAIDQVVRGSGGHEEPVDRLARLRMGGGK